MGRPMATSQDFVNWVCGPELNPAYLKYVLMLEQESVRRFAHGTTHQTMYYPEAKALHALLPDRPTQDAVADVLGELDGKIAANEGVQKLIGQLCATLLHRKAAERPMTTLTAQWRSLRRRHSSRRQWHAAVLRHLHGWRWFVCLP